MVEKVGREGGGYPEGPVGEGGVEGSLGGSGKGEREGERAKIPKLGLLYRILRGDPYPRENSSVVCVCSFVSRFSKPMDDSRTLSFLLD